jgi:hypothetical protein
MVRMLSERATAYAQDLRAWRRDGIVTGLGLEYRRDGVGLPLDLAVKIVLDDLDELNDQAAAGISVADSRWQRLSDDVEQLHRLIADRQPA